MKIKTLLQSLSILTLTLLFSCQQMEGSKKVKISGDIINPKGDSVFIQNYEMGTLIHYAQSPIDENGHFEMELIIEKPLAVSFFDKNESSQMYISPGDEIHISLNTDEFDETIKYIGTSVDENNFMASYYLMFNDRDNGKPIDFYTQSKDLTIDEFYKSVNAHYDDQLDFFTEANTVNQFSNSFVKYMTNKLYMERMGAFVYVFYGNQANDSIPAVKDSKIKIANEIIESRNTAQKNIDKSSYDYLVLNTIPVAVRRLIYLDNPDVKREDIDSIFYLNLSKILSEEELNTYIYDDVNYRLKNFNADYFMSKKIIIDQYMTDVALKEELENAFNELQIELTKGYAKGLNMTNMDSEENQDKTFDDLISKYKGKVIYLDIWASWCGPCKSELPYSKKLKEKLVGKEVVFVYLSTDKKLADWENILVLMQLEGEHYRANKIIHQYLRTEFDMKYIPHYIIFDKDGKLVKNLAPRPSSKEIQAALEALL